MRAGEPQARGRPPDRPIVCAKPAPSSVRDRSGARAAAFAAAFALLAAACGGGRDAAAIRVLDLVRESDGAEMRPSRAAFEVVDHTLAGEARPSIRTNTPSRLVFTLPIPRRS